MISQSLKSMSIDTTTFTRVGLIVSITSYYEKLTLMNERDIYFLMYLKLLSLLYQNQTISHMNTI